MIDALTFEELRDLSKTVLASLLANSEYTTSLKKRRSLNGKSREDIIRAVAKDAIDFALEFQIAIAEVWNKTPE